MDGLALKTILLSYCIGTLRPLRLTLAEYSNPVLRPFGAPRLDFWSIFGPKISHRFSIDFLIDFGAIWDQFWDPFGIIFGDFGSILHHFFEHRFLIDFWLIFDRLLRPSTFENPRKTQLKTRFSNNHLSRTCSDLALILAPIFMICLSFWLHFSTLFRHRFWYRFLH